MQWAHPKVVGLVQACPGVQPNVEKRGKEPSPEFLQMGHWVELGTQSSAEVWACYQTFVQTREGSYKPSHDTTPRKGFHLAACCIIQQEKCGSKSQYYVCPWPEGCRQWLGLFASMFIKGLISYIRLNFTLGIFSMGFLAKLILLSNKNLQF